MAKSLDKKSHTKPLRLPQTRVHIHGFSSALTKFALSSSSAAAAAATASS